MSVTAGSIDFTSLALQILLGHGGSKETDLYLEGRSRRLAQIYSIAGPGEVRQVDIALPRNLFRLAAEVGSESGLSIGAVVEAWAHHGFAYARKSQAADDDPNHWILQLEGAVRERLPEFASERLDFSRHAAAYCRALRAAAPTAVLLALAQPDLACLEISGRDPAELERVHQSIAISPGNAGTFSAHLAAALLPPASEASTIDVLIPERLVTLLHEVAGWSRRGVNGVLASAITAYERSLHDAPMERLWFVRSAELMQHDISRSNPAFTWVTIHSVPISKYFSETCDRAQGWFGIASSVCGGLAALRGITRIVERERKALGSQPLHFM